MEAIFRMKKSPYCISMAKGMEKKEPQPGRMNIIQVRVCQEEPSYIVESTFEKEEQEEGLEDSKVLVVAGRGIGKKENMEILTELADRTGAMTGVSRPAAMNAWSADESSCGRYPVQWQVHRSVLQQEYPEQQRFMPALKRVNLSQRSIQMNMHQS